MKMLSRSEYGKCPKRYSAILGVVCHESQVTGFYTKNGRFVEDPLNGFVIGPGMLLFSCYINRLGSDWVKKG